MLPIYLKHGTFVVYMLYCSLHWPHIFLFLRNVFEATISHIMPLIVTEFNLSPVAGGGGLRCL